MDDATPHHREAMRQDLANHLLHAAVDVSGTAGLLDRLTAAAPPTADHQAIIDLRQAAAFIDQARRQLIACADALTGADEPP